MSCRQLIYADYYTRKYDYIFFTLLFIYTTLETIWVGIALPLIPLTLHSLFIFFFKKWLGPVGTIFVSITSISVVTLLIIVEFLNVTVYGYANVVDLGRWFFCLDMTDVDFEFCSDNLALITSILVLFLSALALYFGAEYMYREPFANRLLYLLNLFTTSVIFLFFCYDYFLILLAWEFIGLFSLLLVNFYSTRVYTIKATLKTFVFSRVSDMFMFLSLVLVINTFSSTDLSLIFTEVPFIALYFLWFANYPIHVISFLATCLLLSGVVKAAQFFFHVWLPDAMEAPTPASALIHSSTLVIAGVFLIIRFSVLFEFSKGVNFWMAILGSLTLAFGSITAVFQNDIKKLVAYSTISQIGYLVCGCGFSCYEEVLTYLIIHALNKAFLFVLVGYIVHFFDGNTDMRQMGGAYMYSFDVTVLFFGVALNLSGLPWSTGFVGKEFLLFQSLRDSFVVYFVRSCWSVGFFFTPIYMLLPVFVVMFGPKKGAMTSYSSAWEENSKYSFLMSSYSNWLTYQSTTVLICRFIFTSVTSKLTSIILFSFWLFFFSYGESFFFIIFNLGTLLDTITSSSFFTIKQHLIFSTTTYSMPLFTSLSIQIFFFSIQAFIYLILINNASSYKYFEFNTFYNFWLNISLLLIFI